MGGLIKSMSGLNILEVKKAVLRITSIIMLIKIKKITTIIYFQKKVHIKINSI